MVTAYRTCRPAMDHHVAVRAIDASLVPDDEAVARFQQDARLIARPKPLHIRPVYYPDGTQVPLYIVMRYLEDGTVRDVLAGEPLPFTEIAFLVQ